ncbi:MAG: hypothetical protein D6680_07965 [Cyanobacteria bacterium J007]|nr:MAG: hypothetical protein D6680_07965 [Cyanobacteria bacterium J007]
MFDKIHAPVGRAVILPYCSPVWRPTLPFDPIGLPIERNESFLSIPSIRLFPLGESSPVGGADFAAPIPQAREISSKFV